jgi:hypothetical protein
MRKITHYLDVTWTSGYNGGKKQEAFSYQVNALIKGGYQPLGGVTICQNYSGDYVMAQAMVKYEEKYDANFEFEG